MDVVLTLILPVEFPLDGRELTALGLRDLDRLPSSGCADECAEHRFQDGSFGKRIRGDLETATFFHKQALEQVGDPDGLPVRRRAQPMRRFATFLRSDQSAMLRCGLRSFVVSSPVVA